MKFIHCKQDDEFDCGLACVNSILKYYKIGSNIEFIKDQYSNRGEYSLFAIKNILESTNSFACKAYNINTSNISNNTFSSINLPCIALVDNGGFNHYIVIYKFTKSKVIISDPNNEKISSMKINDFNKIFKKVILTINKTNDTTIETSTNLKKQLLKDILNKNYIAMLGIIIFSIAFVVFSTLSNFYFKVAIDYIMPGKLNNLLLPLTFCFIAISIISVLFNYIRNIYIVNISIKVDRYISDFYFSKLLNLPFIFFENRDVGQILSRFNDSVYFRNTISTIISSTILDIILIIATSLVLYNLDKYIFLVVILSTILLVCISMLFYNLIDEKNRKSMIYNSEVNSLLIQFLKKSQSIFALNKKSYFLDLFQLSYEKKLHANKEEMKVDLLSNFFKMIIQSIFPLMVLFIGFNKILCDKSTLGDIIFINSLIGFMFGSTSNILNLQTTIQKSIVCTDRMCDILLYPKNNAILEEFHENINTIEIKNLNFSYSGFNNNLLEIDELLFEKKDKVIILGESGIGKSTLAKILVKLNTIDDGKLFLNGKDINRLKDECVREQIMYINSDPFIHTGTIKENLCLGSEFEDSEIIEACKKARIWDFINSSEKKLNFLISEDGSNLSTGQKQRLSLARVFLKNPSVLIIDEAISNIDNSNLSELYHEIFNLDSIVLFITHNMSLLKNYNKLLRLERNGFEFIKNNEKEDIEICI